MDTYYAVFANDHDDTMGDDSIEAMSPVDAALGIAHWYDLTNAVVRVHGPEETWFRVTINVEGQGLQPVPAPS